MKKLALLCMAALGIGLMGCSTDPKTEKPAEEKQPTIALEKGKENVDYVTFTVSTTDATEARYMVLEDGEDAPALATIMAEGDAIELVDGKAEVKAAGLAPDTDYMIVAAAKNQTKMAGSNTLYVKTTDVAEVDLDVEIVQVAHTSIHFRFTAVNAEKVAFLVQNATKEAPEAADVLRKGDEVDPEMKEAVEVTDLDPVKDYVLYVAAEGNGLYAMEAVEFTTKDDPSNVIEHNYTRVKGSKYGSNYYLMFSYEDANEAENFAYNDKTLCLDFYGDPDKDYLPAGTYEVKESTEWPCLSNMRYSTYGYDNGVQLKGGVANVSIDPDTKAYTFELNLQLKDGRSLEAHYTGDVDNMPVVDIVTVATTCTTASATTNDNGKNWTLTMADAEGNKALFNLANAFYAPYIAKNTYTISTSAEEFRVKRAAAEMGQFDSETSYFEVAGENGHFKFSKGTLNVDIDWTNQKYLITFYGELENGYVIELQFNDAIEGVSLAQSEEVISVEMDVATAKSYDPTNYYLTFTKNENGVEMYRLVLDAYCPSMAYLPAGTYSTKEAIDGCRLDGETSTLYITGEGQYYAKEARAEVFTDMVNKTYTFNMSFQIEDGRTFAFSYVGKVDGSEIVDSEIDADAIEWTVFSAKRWYGDNWELKVVSADEANTLVFDLRVGDSSASYLLPGVYELNADEAQYIDGSYSMFNKNKNVFKAAVLSVMYDEGTGEHTIMFDVTINDGSNFTGNYQGVLGSH